MKNKKLVFAVIALAAVIALLLHRFRRMESAGDVIAIRHLKPVFLYCFTVGCSLVLGYVLANLLLWGGTALFAVLSGTVMGNLLWHYPWGLHAGICAAMLVLITALYILPMRRLHRYLPIENIKSRK